MGIFGLAHGWSGLRKAEGIFRTGSALFPGSLIRVSLPEQRENIVGANVRMWHIATVHCEAPIWSLTEA